MFIIKGCIGRCFTNESALYPSIFLILYHLKVHCPLLNDAFVDALQINDTFVVHVVF